jgi:hypothetical protein
MTTLQAGGLIPFLIFVAFAIIAAFFEKRAKKEKERARNPMPGEPRRKSWEEELQDLLQNRPAPPPMRRDVPPPPPVYAPAPPPLPYEQQQEVEVYLPPPQPKIEPVFQPAHGLSHADDRYAHAASIQQRVEQHMAAVSRRGPSKAETAHHEISVRTNEAVELVRNQRNLRSAILASVILGPPKSLEVS